jgi:hypothetical protein
MTSCHALWHVTPVVKTASASAGKPDCGRITHVGKNAFDGYVPSVPEGEKLDYASECCNELETLGMQVKSL